VLNESGFISIEDIGRERYCTIKQDGFKDLQKWLEYFDAFWGSKLEKLGKLLIDKKTKK
jgi:hypothetical protein